MKPARGFIQIVIVALIAFALGVASIHFLQKYIQSKEKIGDQTPTIPTKHDPTANWKTYIVEKALSTSRPDIKYKYSLKYPQDWTFKENGLTTFFLPPGESYIKDKIPKSIYISVRDSRAAVLPVYIKYKTIREVKIENETVKILQAENLTTERYLAEITRGNYVIEFTFSKDLDSKYDDIFYQILSTFKFL